MTNRKLTTGFPTSYRRSAYITPKVSQRVAQKAFFCFLNNIQFQSNKVLYRDSFANHKVFRQCWLSPETSHNSTKNATISVMSLASAAAAASVRSVNAALVWLWVKRERKVFKRTALYIAIDTTELKHRVELCRYVQGSRQTKRRTWACYYFLTNKSSYTIL